jgi:hypothetical protein
MPLTRAPSSLVNTNIVDLGTSTNIDCSTGTYFIKNITGATTLTISNVPSDRAYAFTLRVSGANNGTITWWNGVVWPNYITATITAGNMLFMFVTDNGGITWRGSSLSGYVA